jgi:hypothetical protein
MTAERPSSCEEALLRRFPNWRAAAAYGQVQADGFRTGWHERGAEIARLTQERDDARREAEDTRSLKLAASSGAASVVSDQLAEANAPPRSAQPSADHTERAREVISEWLEHDLTSWLDTELAELRELIAAALTAARREERQLRALDEAVIEAADAYLDEQPPAEWGDHAQRRAWTAARKRLQDALAARDAASGKTGS